MLSYDLHSHRKSRSESAGNRYRGKTHDVDEDCADISEIHLKRIGQALSCLEGGCGSDRADDDVIFGECLVECLIDQVLNLKRLVVVCIVIAS